MKAELTRDDLLAIALLAREALDAWEQADDARAARAHQQAETLDAERKRAIAQIYKLLENEAS